MESIRQLYKIGQGPSSSHTMGPRKAAKAFAREAEGASSCTVTLFGSLAATGKGPLTDKAILDELQPLFLTEIEWKPETVLPFHTNAMTFKAVFEDGREPLERTYYSIGGGDL